MQDRIELTQKFACYLTDFGIDGFGYAPIDAWGQPIQAESATTWSQDLLDFFYGQSLVEVEPAVAQALNRAQPFQWSRIADPQGLDRRAVVAMGKVEVGLADGITIGLPGPRGCVALVDLTVRRKGPALGLALDRRQDELYLAALEFHTMSRALIGLGATPAPPAPRRLIALTERERECCLWLARGMSTGQISEKLKISERTVLFHCGNVRRKLKASSRSHAVAMLVREQAIHP